MKNIGCTVLCIACASDSLLRIYGNAMGRRDIQSSHTGSVLRSATLGEAPPGDVVACLLQGGVIMKLRFGNASHSVRTSKV